MTRKRSALEDALACLHDGHLVGVRTDGGSVSLECRHPSGEDQVIHVRGVDEMCCNNFRDGNTILDVELFHSIDEVHALAEGLVEALAQSTKPEHVEAHLVRSRNKESQTAMRYLVLESSYGADIVIAFHGTVTLTGARGGSLEE